MKKEIITVIISAVTGSLATLLVQYISKISERIKRARDMMVRCEHYLNSCLQTASDNKTWCIAFDGAYKSHHIFCSNPTIFPEFSKMSDFLDIELINLITTLQTDIKHVNRDLETFNERKVFFNDNFILNNINEERFQKNLSSIGNGVTSISNYIEKYLFPKLLSALAYIRISLRKSNKRSIFLRFLIKYFRHAKPSKYEIDKEKEIIKSEIDSIGKEYKREIEDAGV